MFTVSVYLIFHMVDCTEYKQRIRWLRKSQKKWKLKSSAPYRYPLKSYTSSSMLKINKMNSLNIKRHKHVKY